MKFRCALPLFVFATVFLDISSALSIYEMMVISSRSVEVCYNILLNIGEMGNHEIHRVDKNP